MAKKKSTPKINAGNFTSDSEAKISNPKGKWGQVKKIAKRAQKKAKSLSYDELKDLAREYNAKLPKGSKKRISLKQSGEKISAALGIKPAQEKELKPQPTEKKSPAKTGEAWGKTLDKVEQGKPKLSAETKGDFRKQVKEAAKKLVADKPKVEIEKPAPKETIDGLVKVVEAKKKEIKSKDGKDKSTPEGYTKSELYNLAKDAKVPGYTKMNKQQLFDSLGIGKKEEAKKPEPIAEVKKPDPKKKENKKTEPATEVEKTKKNRDSLMLDTKKTSEVDLGRETESDLILDSYASSNSLDEVERKNYEKVMDYGRAEIASIRKEINEMESNPEYKALGNVNKVMERYRDNLIASSHVTHDQAQAWTKSLQYDQRWENLIKKEDMQNSLALIYRLSGGHMNHLKRINAIPGRSCASQHEKAIKMNGMDFHKRLDEVIWHESGHHIEFSLPLKAKKMTQFFLESRATGNVKPLNELADDRSFDEDEKAYPDKFIHPYVGKWYPTGATEVITEVFSMGLQYFAEPSLMRELMDADPDHFALILGLLKVARDEKKQGRS